MTVITETEIETLLRKGIFNLIYAIDNQDGMVLIASIHFLSSLLDDAMFLHIIEQVLLNYDSSVKSFVKSVLKEQL